MAKKPGEQRLIKPDWQVQADQQAERGRLIERLAKEASMWRQFAEVDCHDGRYVWESQGFAWHPGEAKTFLSAYMDSITAPMWKAFALQMANTAETRLKEML